MSDDTGSVTLTISGKTSPERLLATIREQAPHLLTDSEPPSAPAPRRHSAPLDAEPLLTPQEVATMFRCDVKTATRWAKAGKLHAVRTPGGHRRFFENEVNAMLRGETWELPPEYANAA